MFFSSFFATYVTRQFAFNGILTPFFCISFCTARFDNYVLFSGIIYFRIVSMLLVARSEPKQKNVAVLVNFSPSVLVFLMEFSMFTDYC